MLKDWQLFLRFATAFNDFLNTTLTVDEARSRVLRLLRAREENFLRVIKGAVFDHPGSPYLALCRHARIQFGDVEQLVKQDGLEATLERLERAGVFVTIAEFQGRHSIRRPGLELPVEAGDFDNPMSTRHRDNQSGGSTGAPRRSAFDLNLAANTAPIEMLFFQAAGLLGRPVGVYRTGLPSVAGFIKTLYQIRMG